MLLIQRHLPCLNHWLMRLISPSKYILLMHGYFQTSLISGSPIIDTDLIQLLFKLKHYQVHWLQALIVSLLCQVLNLINQTYYLYSLIWSILLLQLCRLYGNLCYISSREASYIDLAVILWTLLIRPQAPPVISLSLKHHKHQISLQLFLLSIQLSQKLS